MTIKQNNLRKSYFGKANHLIERLLDEEPEEEPTEEEQPEEEEVEDQEDSVDDTDEQGQAQQVEVYFNNLDEEAQKILIDTLKENLNIAEDDNYAHQKLVNILAKEPLVTFRAEELVRKLNIDI